ncbi:MAG: Vitamin B12 dependent methionine synthase activation subunit [Clostridia bacterium]|nr:Vitamin B12 dependent methionine synthase activation subunit [Clostridia bacterium]
MNNIIIKTYPAPPINKKEVLRYAGGGNDDNTLKLLEECIKEISNALTYKVCYCELSSKTNKDICDFDIFQVKSQNLATNLKDCNKVIVMGATVGITLDRLIAKYSRISPAKALILQALGAERIEALCDTFCEDIKKSLKITLKPRFSAGYGDLPLDTQNSIFTLLNLPKNIGLTLNDSMLMSPSKSVTAFIGIQEV